MLISRHVTDPELGDHGINYEMGLSSNASAGMVRAYIRHKAIQGEEDRLDGLGSSDIVVSNTVYGVEIPIGEWSHVAGVYNSELLRMDLYVNEELVAYRTDATVIPAEFYKFSQPNLGHEVTIGALRSTGAVASGFQGWLDNVAIHTHALGTNGIM